MRGDTAKHQWILVDDASRRRYGTPSPSPWQCCCCQTIVQHDRDLVIHNLHSTSPLISIVLSRLDRGIQSVTEMLPSLDKGGNCVAHGFNCTPLTRLPNMCLADALVFVLYQLGLTVCRQAATVTMVIGQHAVYAGKSIPVPCKIGISHRAASPL